MIEFPAALKDDDVSLNSSTSNVLFHRRESNDWCFVHKIRGASVFPFNSLWLKELEEVISIKSFFRKVKDNSCKIF